MTPRQIEELANLCARSGVTGVELAQEGFSLRLRVEPAIILEPEAGGAEAPKPAPAFNGVRAPGVGLFRLAHPTTGRPVAEAGQAVRQGDTVGVLQVGLLLKPVVAQAGGILGEALVEDGAVVGYGTPLYPLS